VLAIDITGPKLRQIPHQTSFMRRKTFIILIIHVLLWLGPGTNGTYINASASTVGKIQLQNERSENI